MISCGTVPFISAWLYRLAVRRAARGAATGDVPAVRDLAAVFCTSPDPGARDIAGQGLRHLKSRDQIAVICRESLLWDNDDLAALAQGCGYLPPAPAEQALWLFNTSQTEELRRLDPEDHCPLLAAGYRGASAVTRARARSAARANGTSSMLARAMTGSGVTQYAGDWTYDEWDIIVTGLIAGQQWDDLWLLAALAPAPLAVTATAALMGAGWTPAGDDKLAWDRMCATVPDCWTYPLPAGEARAPAGRPAARAARLCFSPDGSLLVTGCRDGIIAVRRTASAGPAAEFPAGPGAVRFLAPAAGNELLVYGAGDGTVQGYGLQDSARYWSWEGRSHATALGLSLDSRSVGIGDEEGHLHVCDARDGRKLLSLQAHPSPVTCLAHAPGGSPVACGHADGTVSVIAGGGDCGPQHFPGNGCPVHSLAFSPSGTELLVLYEQGHPALLDVAAKTRVRLFTGHAGRAVCSAVSAESGWFAVGSDDHTLRCWNVQQPAPAAVIPLSRRHITCCSATADGSFLATCFHDGTVRIYRMPEGHLLREYKAHRTTITTCAMAPGGTKLATVSWDGTVKLWRLPDGEVLRTLDAHTGGIVSLAGPAGTLIALVTGDGLARVIDASDSTPVSTIDLYTPSVRAAAMNTDGTYLAVAGADATLRCWSVRDGSLAAGGAPLATSLHCCTFLPGSPALVTGGWDGACRFFRLPDLALLRTLSGHTSIVTCCTVSRDGSLLVTGSNDTTVRLWRTADDEAYTVLRGFRSEVGAVALSPDETLLAAGSADRTIRLFRLPYGTPAGELPARAGKVTSLVFSPDGCTLAAGYDSGAYTLFSLPEKAILRTVLVHTGAVTGMAVLSDKRTLLTTGADGTCRFHLLPLVPFLVHADPAGIPAAAPEEASARGSAGHGQRAFFLALLAARFRGEIGICPLPDMAGCFDIQVVG